MNLEVYCIWPPNDARDECDSMQSNHVAFKKKKKKRKWANLLMCIAILVKFVVDMCNNWAFVALSYDSQRTQWYEHGCVTIPSH